MKTRITTWRQLLPVLLLLVNSTSWSRADSPNSTAIFDAYTLIHRRLDESDRLQGPSSTAAFFQVHKAELDMAVKVLAENDVKGVLGVVKQYERLKVSSFDPTLTDFGKAIINEKLATLKLDLSKKVKAAFDRISSSLG